MHLCYIDESGTSKIPGNTSHFVLAGISIPIEKWKNCDSQIQEIKEEYSLGTAEIHTAWMVRKYYEQQRIPEFDSLDHSQRRARVNQIRNARLLGLQSAGPPKKYRQYRKICRQTDKYIHLTLDERIQLIESIARCVASWDFARLFAECIDKVHFDPTKHLPYNLDQVAFDQLVSRFEYFLKNTGTEENPRYGLVIHDNNQTVAKKHTLLMKQFHLQGTLWTKISNIIETPLFVDSELTSMVQIADLCSYALRRFVER